MRAKKISPIKSKTAKKSKPPAKKSLATKSQDEPKNIKGSVTRYLEAQKGKAFKSVPGPVSCYKMSFSPRIGLFDFRHFLERKYCRFNPQRTASSFCASGSVFNHFMVPAGS